VSSSHARSRASRRGRPPKPLDPGASRAAGLGAELRARREAKRLTLQALSACVRYSAQHISMVERGRATATEAFVQACDAELDADGALMRLLPDVVLEQAGIRSARVAARRGPDPPNDREEDGRSVAVLPPAVCEVDPMLPGYWDGSVGDPWHARRRARSASGARHGSLGAASHQQAPAGCVRRAACWADARRGALGRSTRPGCVRTAAIGAAGPRCLSTRCSSLARPMRPTS